VHDSTALPRPRPARGSTADAIALVRAPGSYATRRTRGGPWSRRQATSATSIAPMPSTPCSAASPAHSRDGHAGPCSVSSTLPVLPSRTRRSFPSRASQPTPRSRSWSGSLVPCLNLLSVVTPCSSRYCQIAHAASPISASMLRLCPSAPQPEPHSRLVTNPSRRRQARRSRRDNKRAVVGNLLHSGG
jgi:hypothetical protein